MLRRAGYDTLAVILDTGLVAQRVDEVAAIANDMAQKGRHTVTHNRGTQVIEAGAIRFGLEVGQVRQDGGMAIHILSGVTGQEIELLAFDCFRMNPHYHYGPRNRNERIFLDTTVVSDPLQWALGPFKGGKLRAMIEHAGYPPIAAQQDNDVLASTLREVEAKIPPMMAAAFG